MREEHQVGDVAASSTCTTVFLPELMLQQSLAKILEQYIQKYNLKQLKNIQDEMIPEALSNYKFEISSPYVGVGIGEALGISEKRLPPLQRSKQEDGSARWHIGYDVSIHGTHRTDLTAGYLDHNGDAIIGEKKTVELRSSIAIDLELRRSKMTRGFEFAVKLNSESIT